MINKDNHALYIDSDYDITFGNCDFGLMKDMKKGETYANESYNFLSNNNLELTGGKGNHEEFEVDEFEVYKVTY